MKCVIIDERKCTKDHLCVKVCPLGVLAPDGGGYPSGRPDREEFCIACGHCYAACPSGAITLGKYVDRTEELLGPPPQIPREVFAQFLKSRRSIRLFESRQVSKEDLREILDLASWAPSAKNGQPCRWLVFEDKDRIQRLKELTVDWLAENNRFPAIVEAWRNGADMILRNAPCVVIVHADGRGINPVVDCTIALSHFELIAHQFNLGVCWAGIFMGALQKHAAMRTFLDLPEGHVAYGAVMVGHPRVRYHRVPQREPARITWR